MHKSYAAAAARKPHAAPPTKSSVPTGSSNGATNGKKKADAPAKPNGKDAAAPPGFAAPKRQASAGFSAPHQRVLRHRALFAFRFFVGKAVEIQLEDASVYTGVLDCVDPDDFSVVLKNTHRKSEHGEAFQSGSSVIFKRRQIAHLAVDGTVSYNESAFGAAAAAGGFRTDTEISGRQHEHLIGRELEAASSWLDPQLDSGELEDPSRRRGAAAAKAGGWNQFEANEKLFGVVSTFDETIYTTKLDKTKISTHQSREAERIALEIERQTSSNFHVQEERGHATTTTGGDELDEEARYSSVDRKHGKAYGGGATMPGTGKSANSYVPPALRNAQRPAKPAPAVAAAPAATATAEAPPTAAVTAAVVGGAPAVAGPVSAPKPLSFSDAVTGRTQAAKPEQKKIATGGASATAATVAAASDGKGKKDETKSAPVAVAPVAAPVSPEKKKTAAAKEPAKGSAAKATAKEAKAKADTSPTTKSAKPVASAPPAPAAAAVPATATPAPAPAPASAPAKKGLNPNAKEFKFNVAAAEFTPKFAPPPVTSSPYRGAQQPQLQHHHHAQQQLPHHQHQHQHPQHMGHMHHQPHPAMMYSPMPEEWMYEGAMGLEDPEMMAQGYLPYGVPLVPGAVMQPQVYAPPPHLIPQQNLRMMGGGGDQRQHQHHGGGYGYQQPYTARGYYAPTGAVSGGMPYPGAVPVGVAAPQPPLPPREPSPLEPLEVAGSSVAPPVSPSPHPSAGKASTKK